MKSYSGQGCSQGALEKENDIFIFRVTYFSSPLGGGWNSDDEEIC